ncbi:uncharacterized protein LOC129305380 [Prosopis cineraria]|uniref:uncharacterized protein LOC129305380 n=1 Tax=Prosopis cineraria TaxID=364024 RepID=UPI0024102C63|nr:uncharacterized protein LOC129305380 [Prosopis cineraria]
MSKKKGNGNTMTLKDFHGGSIPSDLPLPSAPGLSMAPIMSTFIAGNPIGPSDHGSLPHNSSLSRHYDDKTPFLTHTAPIGSNFDEDERKPLGGTSGSAPRRTISGESIWGPPSRVEVKSGRGDSLGPKVPSSSQYQVGKGNSYSARLTEASHVGVNSQNLRGSRDQGTNGASPNVWAMRKDVASTVEPDHSACSGPNAVSKLSHASAIDKVSSGRWLSKKVQSQMDFEIGTSSEAESRPTNVNGNRSHNRIDTVDEKGYPDVLLARPAERRLAIDDQIRGHRNDLLEHERHGISKYSEVQSRQHHTDGVQPALNDARLREPELQHSMASEPREWPKLNLLPRTKPLENSEPSVTDNVQLYCQGSDSSHVEIVNEAHGHANIVNPDSAGTESRMEERQRPKLNLKPQSQSLEKLEGNTRSDRFEITEFFCRKHLLASVALAPYIPTNVSKKHVPRYLFGEILSCFHSAVLLGPILPLHAFEKVPKFWFHHYPPSFFVPQHVLSFGSLFNAFHKFFFSVWATYFTLVDILLCSMNYFQQLWLIKYSTISCLNNELTMQMIQECVIWGARPRELVLKERWVDDAINNYGAADETNRIEYDRAEKLSDHSMQTCYSELPEDAHLDQQAARKPERRDQWVDAERTQRRNWHSDNRRNMRATDRQQISDRKPSSEMWRKPIEQTDATGLLHGKAASAVELAQAFSRSTSEPKSNDRSSGQRGNTGRSQQTFSRLLGPTPKPPSNGY